MVTGWDMDIDRPKTGETGIDLVLLKPFDVDNFLERIDALLKQKQNAGESPLDDELRMLRMFKGLAGTQKELFLKEAMRMAEAD